MSAVVAAALDVVLVVVFATVGRRSHAQGLTLGGVAQTAWPFLAGTVAGWLVALLTLDSSPRSLTFGAVVVASTVVVGMLLRVFVTGAGTAASFVVVATTVLAVFLLGWRLVARLAA
ncbi:MAG TPA: DUF3054 domain-containing protein [Pengzhenrongella sp.]